MLKNKKAVYILIPLNLLIWGFFAYRFYSAYTESDTPLIESNPVSIKAEVQKDSVIYKLSMDYKDPFLKDVKREATAHIAHSGNPDPAQVKKPVVVKEKVAPPPKILPEIRYMGLIKNSTSGTSTALVSVNGNSKLIKQNESVDGIVFKSFNKDSLVARWGKERIVVRR